MFDRFIIHDKGFRNIYEKGVPVGFVINVRINYYRGIPLSMLDDVKVIVDGETFTTDDMTFVVNGVRYTFKEMNETSNVYWFFGDDLRIEINKPGGLRPGKKVVELYLTPRNSYFGRFQAYAKKTMTFA
jgi:hypothetical protein